MRMVTFNVIAALESRPHFACGWAPSDKVERFSTSCLELPKVSSEEFRGREARKCSRPSLGQRQQTVKGLLPGRCHRLLPHRRKAPTRLPWHLGPHRPKMLIQTFWIWRVLPRKPRRVRRFATPSPFPSRRLTPQCPSRHHYGHERTTWHPAIG